MCVCNISVLVGVIRDYCPPAPHRVSPATVAAGETRIVHVQQVYQYCSDAAGATIILCHYDIVIRGGDPFGRTTGSEKILLRLLFIIIVVKNSFFGQVRST